MALPLIVVRSVLTDLPVLGIITPVADSIKTALAEAKNKLDTLVTERRKIDEQILDWKRVVDSLCAVSEDVSDSLPPDVEVTVRVQKLQPNESASDDNPTRVEAPPVKVNFTNAIRTILRLRETRVVPVPEIRDELIACGFDFSKYKQKLVPIHNALKRLEEQGEVRPTRNEQGRVKGYQWIAPIERAMSEETDWISRQGGMWAQAAETIRDTLRKSARQSSLDREAEKLR